MGFVWCSISGRLYGKQAPPEVDTPHTITQDSELLSVLKKGKGEQHQQAVDFLTHLAVCNTVVPATTAAGQLIYQVKHCLQIAPSGHHSSQFCPNPFGITSINHSFIHSFVRDVSSPRVKYVPSNSMTWLLLSAATWGMYEDLCKLCIAYAAAATLL